MKPAARCLLLAFAAAISAWLAAREPEDEHAGRSLARRLLGPFAGIAATVELTRFDALWRAGEHARAWVHADRALDLAPEDPSGWVYVAHRAVYERAAPGRGAPLGERRRWVEVGLALLERGEARARRPGPVAFKRGIVFLSLATEPDGERALPIPRAEAWLRAAEAFERAAAQGEPLAAEAARLTRAAAAAGDREQ